MSKLLSNEQLGEIRLGVSFIPPGPVAKKFQQLLGHIDAQADLIAEQARAITARDLAIAERDLIAAES